jgi:hypothetical protein
LGKVCGQILESLGSLGEGACNLEAVGAWLLLLLLVLLALLVVLLLMALLWLLLLEGVVVVVADDVARGGWNADKPLVQ